MRIERIIWLVAVLVVAGVGFYGGRLYGTSSATQQRAQASNQFFSERGGGPGGQNGAPGGQEGQGGQGNRGGVAGTVNAITDNSITITDRNGQTVTIQLTADGTVHKQVDGALSDIKQGDTIIATGSRNGANFEATSIQIGGQFGNPGATPPNAAPNGSAPGAAPAGQP